MNYREICMNRNYLMREKKGLCHTESFIYNCILSGFLKPSEPWGTHTLTRHDLNECAACLMPCLAFVVLYRHPLIQTRGGGAALLKLSLLLSTHYLCLFWLDEYNILYLIIIQLASQFFSLHKS